MQYSNPANLAILACPGGSAFADELLIHLKNHYLHIFNRSKADMAKRYSMGIEDVEKYINFVNEISASGQTAHHSDNKLHVPRFKMNARWSLFPNGEVKAEILESVRGKDVYIVQDVENHYPVSFNDGTLTRAMTVNDHLMMIFVTVDAVKQAAAGRITLVLPVYPYSRQHKRKGREGLTASRIGSILENLGVDRIITLDIHSREIGNGFNRMRIENLHASYQIIQKLSGIIPLQSDELVVVAPDTGAVDRNKFYATGIKKPLALLYKERDYSRVTKNAMESNIAEIKLLGKVRGKIVFMADDMIGTGGTLLKAMQFLKDEGAKQVICAVSLPVFSGDAINYFDEAYKKGLFYRIIGTNAVYHEELWQREWFVFVNITKLFAHTISRLHQGLSLSSILDNRDMIIKTLLLKNETPAAPEAN
ncbi:MAG: ribose-phosphate diphosphokinase [Spirochaetaceae bacterium]|jgi:ribose-phosphate pyrophosphokinase|nr:ribose-phosphate diphosphokinase [Spirochaetaceae bacterium]GMO15645.1 MAG: ribose-phosphate pyrophosphokinase [Termitinemataceae bacterium]